MKLMVSIQIHIVLLFTGIITMTSWFFLSLHLQKTIPKKVFVG